MASRGQQKSKSVYCGRGYDSHLCIYHSIFAKLSNRRNENINWNADLRLRVGDEQFKLSSIREHEQPLIRLISVLSQYFLIGFNSGQLPKK